MYVNPDNQVADVIGDNGDIYYNEQILIRVEKFWSTYMVVSSLLGMIPNLFIVSPERL